MTKFKMINNENINQVSIVSKKQKDSIEAYHAFMQTVPSIFSLTKEESAKIYNKMEKLSKARFETGAIQHKHQARTTYTFEQV